MDALTSTVMLSLTLTLGKVGYHQSYTYFTWRESAAELREYLEELVESAP